MKTHRLGPDTIRVLAALRAWPRSASDAAPTLADLGRRVKMSPQSVHAHLVKLEVAGLASRTKGAWRSWRAVK